MLRCSLVWKTGEKQFSKSNPEILLHSKRRNASRARRRARPRRPPSTRRTRFGRARRGADVTAGQCAAPASTRACRPWQVAGPSGANPPASAPSAACHWPPERRTSPAMPSPPLRGLVARHVPTYPNRPPRSLISRSSPSLARMRACPSRRRPPLPPLGEHRAPIDFLAHP
jgi:hypothetical protein